MTRPLLHWTGGRLDGTAWQGIRYLSVELPEVVGEYAAVVTAHLNRPAGSLTAGDVRVTGSEGAPVSAHDVTLAERGDGGVAVLRFRGVGGRSPYTVTLTDGGGSPLHPFFASADFTFGIDCPGGDCRALPPATAQSPETPPAVDLLAKDFNGFVTMLTDWARVQNPNLQDLSPAGFERVLLDLLAWAGDMTSYYQDRVANEAFIETAAQRHSLRQHALLLGATMDDGCAPTTLLGFDVETSGFVPEGTQVRARTDPGEVPVTYVLPAQARLLDVNSSDRLKVAAFPDAADAEVPAGTTELLLWGHDVDLEAGDRLAILQGTLSQVVTLAERPRRLRQRGWVADPSDSFDPATDGSAEVTLVRWKEPLSRAVRPWSGTAPLRLYGNLVDAVYGIPRRALLSSGSRLARDEIPLHLDRGGSVLAAHPTGAGTILRALRVPEWPVVHVDDGAGHGVPAVRVVVGDEEWTRVEHLHSSQSYDLHYTAVADEDGAVWLGFGDGVNGREVLVPDDEPVELLVEYRTGDPLLGNVGLDTLVEIVRPTSGDDRAVLDALGTKSVTNVVAATGGRAPQTLERTRQMLPSTLRHGALERAVTLKDYATVAAQVPGVSRATARDAGGPFNTVLVLVDPQGAGDLTEVLRRRIAGHVEARRMTGREAVVVRARYVPLAVQLLVTPRAGHAAHRVRDRVLAELLPGSDDRPGWFHPDRLGFDDDVRLAHLLAFVQGIEGVQSVTPLAFRPLHDRSDPAVRNVVLLGAEEVARLDGDLARPEHGTLEVRLPGLATSGRPAGSPETGAGRRREWRITRVVRREEGSPQARIRAVAGVHDDGRRWWMATEEVVGALARGDRFYVEEPVGDRVDVVVARTASGQVYLRTTADGDEPNNLLALPDMRLSSEGTP